MYKSHLSADTNPVFVTDGVVEMIRTVLDNNILFNGKEYVQTNGVAIGSKLEGKLACSYTRKWNEKTTREKTLFYDKNK